MAGDFRGHGDVFALDSAAPLSFVMPIVKEIVAAIDEKYALARAASWDRVGLQIGDENARVEKVLVAHEIVGEVLDAAHGFDALVVYHPLIFRALDDLNFRNHTARLAARCIAQNLNVIAVHTALDHASAPDALGDKLAQSLGLENIEVLQPDGFEALCKIVVFVPDQNLEDVQNAMWNAGAGQIGKYDCASFRARGTGTFRPLEGANPFNGEIGKIEYADEWRLEIIALDARKNEIVRAMKSAHPYEEVAFDIIPLQNREANQAYGSCRVGTLPQSTPLQSYAREISEKLRAPSTRVVESKSEIQKIACIPGSGASYISAAARAGCDCLVTGDIKHHDALQARALGLSIIDVTHAATEREAVSIMADALSTLDVEIVKSEIETNPFAAV
jgi:dinuclear metal center YbgI/SA1388 family protein